MDFIEFLQNEANSNQEIEYYSINHSFIRNGKKMFYFKDRATANVKKQPIKLVAPQNIIYDAETDKYTGYLMVNIPDTDFNEYRIFKQQGIEKSDLQETPFEFAYYNELPLESTQYVIKIDGDKAVVFYMDVTEKEKNYEKKVRSLFKKELGKSCIIGFIGGLVMFLLS